MEFFVDLCSYSVGNSSEYSAWLWEGFPGNFVHILTDEVIYRWTYNLDSLGLAQILEFVCWIPSARVDNAFNV